MTKKELQKLIFSKKSVLCVGLDTDLSKIPPSLASKYDTEVIEIFNKKVINATIKYTIAYKINLAFYEIYGAKGYEMLRNTIAYIKSLNEPVFLIADGKRNDIGNTAEKYAQAYFSEPFDFDAITINPLMGRDTLDPFLKFENKWIIPLGLTSNPGAQDFLLEKTINNEYFFEKIMKTLSSDISSEKMMFVVGATQQSLLQHIRLAFPDYFFLIPGIGAQGGNLQDTIKNTLTSEGNILINVSRDIIYTDNSSAFQQKIEQKAREYQDIMASYLS
jgi:orotidine-5'-phosphate decarboxylase